MVSQPPHLVWTCPRACSDQVCSPPSSSSPPFPRSLIFHPLRLLTAVEKAGCSTYFKRQSNREARGSVGVHISFLLQAFTAFKITLAYFHVSSPGLGKEKKISISELTKVPLLVCNNKKGSCQREQEKYPI